MGLNGSIEVPNYHELNRIAFKPRSPGSCFFMHGNDQRTPGISVRHYHEVIMTWKSVSQLFMYGMIGTDQ